jgi:hypothetical protein
MAAVFGIRVVQWRRYLGNNYFTIGAFGGVSIKRQDIFLSKSLSEEPLKVLLSGR